MMNIRRESAGQEIYLKKEKYKKNLKIQNIDVFCCTTISCNFCVLG